MMKETKKKRRKKNEEIELIDHDVLEEGNTICTEGEEELKPNEKIIKHWTFN